MFGFGRANIDEGFDLYDAGDYGRASEVFRRCIKDGNSAGWLGLGLCLIMLPEDFASSEYSAAATNCFKFIVNKDGNPDAVELAWVVGFACVPLGVLALRRNALERLESGGHVIDVQVSAAEFVRWLDKLIDLVRPNVESAVDRYGIEIMSRYFHAMIQLALLTDGSRQFGTMSGPHWPLLIEGQWGLFAFGGAEERDAATDAIRRYSDAWQQPGLGYWLNDPRVTQILAGS